MLSASEYVSLLKPLRDFTAKVLSEEFLDFCCFFMFSCWNTYYLNIEFRNKPTPCRWYNFIIYNTIIYYIGIRLLMHKHIPDSPHDLRHTWMAVSDVLAHLPTYVRKPEMAFATWPVPLFNTLIPYFRRPWEGASSCPWADWVLWCYAGHFLCLASLKLAKAEGESHPVIASSISYALAMCILIDFYEWLALFGRDKLKWAALVAAVPVLSHAIGEFAEETLQNTSFTMGFGPHLEVYIFTTIISNALLFWNMNVSSTDLDALEFGIEKKWPTGHFGAVGTW